MGDIKCHRPLSIESVLLPAEGKRPQRSFIFGSYAFQMPNWNEPSEVDDECRQLNEYPPDGKRPSMQREETPTMTTGLERIAAKARKKRTLRFTSLAHHLTRERVGRI